MKLSMFHAYGIELEYMIVDASTLNVKPISDQLFNELQGFYRSDVSRGDIDWSNELALHVIELKNPKPVESLNRLGISFQKEISDINTHLRSFNAMLMPGSMHPWMNPKVETQLWPHEGHEVYDTYHKLFDCHRHGWSNLQSAHINLGFANDDEFHKLHSAIRFLLPLMPALTASSPVVEGRTSDCLSTRMKFYLENQKKIPSIMGHCIPEVCPTRSIYQSRILNPIAQDISKFDPHKILRAEWLNSRGVIPKFSRDSVEIRLCDIQESAHVDLAIAWFWIECVKHFVINEPEKIEEMNSFSTLELRFILDQTIQDGERTLLGNLDYLKIFGVDRPLLAQELFYEILGRLKGPETLVKVMEELLYRGSLSTRILRAFQEEKASLREIYAELCSCLHRGIFFEV